MQRWSFLDLWLALLRSRSRSGSVYHQKNHWTNLSDWQIFPYLPGLRPASSGYQPPMVGALGYPWFLDFPWPYSTSTHGVCFDQKPPPSPRWSKHFSQKSWFDQPESHKNRNGLDDHCFWQGLSQTSSLTWFFFPTFVTLTDSQPIVFGWFRSLNPVTSWVYWCLWMFMVYFRCLFPCHKTIWSLFVKQK